MNSELKDRLDELNELMEHGYITDAEYAAARINLLMDAGFDIMPRLEAIPAEAVSARADMPPPPALRSIQDRKQRHNGCAILLLLMLFLLAGAGLAVVSVNALSGVREALTRFMDDIRGNPGTFADPVRPVQPQNGMADVKPTEPVGVLIYAVPSDDTSEFSTPYDDDGYKHGNSEE